MRMRLSVLTAKATDRTLALRPDIKLQPVAVLHLLVFSFSLLLLRSAFSLGQDLLEEIFYISSHVLRITADVRVSLLFYQAVLDELSLLREQLLNVDFRLSLNTREGNEELELVSELLLILLPLLLVQIVDIGTSAAVEESDGAPFIKRGRAIFGDCLPRKRDSLLEETSERCDTLEWQSQHMHTQELKM